MTDDKAVTWRVVAEFTITAPDGDAFTAAEVVAFAGRLLGEGKVDNLSLEIWAEER